MCDHVVFQDVLNGLVHSVGTLVLLREGKVVLKFSGRGERGGGGGERGGREGEREGEGEGVNKVEPGIRTPLN